MADAGASNAAAKKEDPFAEVKAALDVQMRRQPYRRFDKIYEGGDFAESRFAELVPWGRDQTFTGLTRGTPKGAHTPHGWGVLEHHEGFVQACAVWRDGVADGPGMWSMSAEGQEQCGYGNWVEGKRDGYFALVKEGGVYIEEYDRGDLKRRIKWRKDKLHVKCTRCNMLFVPSANTSEEKFCRFHLNKVEHDGRFPCCGALQSVNPRGCSTSMHVGAEEPASAGDRSGMDSIAAATAALNLGDGRRGYGSAEAS
eukprot:TRINITY_DN1591_c0_g1_i1.p1 TRINITY_DN1591_c0_g1~~TRINITY_DN1591_c0_g1_i1.p1  ORF type:complete len:266 (+),score=55.16 TRINITY_DN1591_c0_g1_i1:36-800(+)